MKSIKERMKARGITQVDMILYLATVGIQVTPPLMSSILRGTYTYARAKEVLDACDKMLTRLEQNAG